MEFWRARALECFPELEYEVNSNQGGPLGLWDDLYNALEKAYERSPVDDDLVRRIYDFAAWCFRQPDTGDVETDLSNATAVGLMESLPLKQAVAADLYRWLSIETFEGCENLFRYQLSDEEYRKFHADFLAKKKNYGGPSRL
jgi:hypothetical protein